MRLHVDQLRFAHPGAMPLLDGVDLQVGAGESVAVVGPSGSGKTTFLALLGGLLRPQAVTIRVVDGDDIRPAGGEVSWVLQTVNVLPDRTVLDNVAVGAFADGLDRARAEQRADQVLTAVGLGDARSRPVRTLSGGEAQRVVIARAAVSQRGVLLADEPTGQLDKRTSRQVIDTLLTAAARRVVVVVTHDPDVAARCDRVLKIEDGRLSAVDR